MLTDLRDRLKGVGRLDVMTAVNQRAFRYYADQDLSSLPPVSLERRARILHAMGEDEETQGDHAAALSKFQEAERTTAVLLNEAPNDAERIFDQAQSVYWMGYEDYTQGRSQAARKAFLRYRALSLRMVALAPTSTKYRREMGYAESDLCAVALQKPIDNQGAMQHCGAALTQTEIALHHPDRNSDDPDTRKSIENDLMNSLGNMADAYRVNHDIARARAQRREEEKLVDSELAGDSKNMDLKDTWITIQMALAELDREEGHREAAVARLIGAKQAADSLHHFDPSNLRSINQLNYIKRKLAELAN
jgi:hypothetical protein